MQKEKYIKDLEEIKEIMKQSSRFISLSGWSGISAGIIALIGAATAYRMVYSKLNLSEYSDDIMSDEQTISLFLIAILTLVCAAGAGIFFTTWKTKKSEFKTWNFHTKRLLINLSIPLITGGLICLIFLFRGELSLLPPFTLIFYGLALINTSKYTLPEIRSLGLIEIVLGLVSLQFIGLGLLFWSIGFGILHILYGIIIPYNNKL